MLVLVSPGGATYHRGWRISDERVVKYCRPSESARVVLVSTAEAAGYRPCDLCFGSRHGDEE